MYQIDEELLTVEDLKRTPSALDGLPWESEERFRLLGCQLIQHGGLLLKMPQSAMITGQILFHQLYLQHSFLDLPVLDGTMAALFVAGKVEECYRRARDMVNAFHWLYNRIRTGKQPPRLPYICEEYYDWRDRLTRTEMFLLRDLGFHVQPNNPAVLLLISYLQTFDGLFKHKEAGQLALNILNDAFRTVAPLRYPANVLACAAIQIAAETTGIDQILPLEWFKVFSVIDSVQLEACMKLMQRANLITYDPELPMTPSELKSYSRILRSPSRSRSPHRRRSRSPRRRYPM